MRRTSFIGKNYVVIHSFPDFARYLLPSHDSPKDMKYPERKPPLILFNKVSGLWKWLSREMAISSLKRKGKSKE